MGCDAIGMFLCNRIVRGGRAVATEEADQINSYTSAIEDGGEVSGYPSTISSLVSSSLLLLFSLLLLLLLLFLLLLSLLL